MLEIDCDKQRDSLVVSVQQLLNHQMPVKYNMHITFSDTNSCTHLGKFLNVTVYCTNQSLDLIDVI